MDMRAGWFLGEPYRTELATAYYNLTSAGVDPSSSVPEEYQHLDGARANTVRQLLEFIVRTFDDEHFGIKKKIATIIGSDFEQEKDRLGGSGLMVPVLDAGINTVESFLSAYGLQEKNVCATRGVEFAYTGEEFYRARSEYDFVASQVKDGNEARSFEVSQRNLLWKLLLYKGERNKFTDMADCLTNLEVSEESMPMVPAHLVQSNQVCVEQGIVPDSVLEAAH